MSNPRDILPKKLKFERLKRPQSTRITTMAISLPMNPASPVYVNARLTRELHKNKVEKVYVYTDPENEAIALEPTGERKGYIVVWNGASGSSINAKIRSVMPHGRYIFIEELSSKNSLVFKREYTTINKEDAYGPTETTAH